MKKEVFLSDKKYFELFIGKRVLKEEVFKSKEKIPVYSANVFTPFGFLGKTNIKDFKHDYILWGIDGKFGFNLISNGIKFATTDHCGTIKILDKNIIPEYLLYKLRINANILGFDRTLRPSLANMEKKASINIPVDKKGKFDVKKQKEIAEKYKKILHLKRVLKQKIEELDEIIVEID